MSLLLCVPCVLSYSIRLKIATSVCHKLDVYLSKVVQKAPVIWCSRPLRSCIKVTYCCSLSDVKCCSPAQLPPGHIRQCVDTWPTLAMIDRKYWFISPPHTLIGGHSSFFLSHNRGGGWNMKWPYAFSQRWWIFLHFSLIYFQDMKNSDVFWFPLL